MQWRPPCTIPLGQLLDGSYGLKVWGEGWQEISSDVALAYGQVSAAELEAMDEAMDAGLCLYLGFEPEGDPRGRPQATLNTPYSWVQLLSVPGTAAPICTISRVPAVAPVPAVVSQTK